MNGKIPGRMPTGGRRGEAQPERFTKERVNELMQKRVERSHRAFFDRYGVEDLKGLDELFGRAKSVDELKQRLEEALKSGEDAQSRIEELTEQNKDLAKRNAFSSRNVRPELRQDIEAYFKGKGIDINEETLSEELKTHPGWLSKPGTVQSIGAEPHLGEAPSEREAAGKLLGVQL